MDEGKGFRLVGLLIVGKDVAVVKLDGEVGKSMLMLMLA